MSSTVDGMQALKLAFDDVSQAFSTANVSSLVPENYNELDLAYSGGNLVTVTYKFDGATVATLTLSYSAGNLVQVLRS